MQHVKHIINNIWNTTVQHMKHMDAIFEPYSACMPLYLVIMRQDGMIKILISLLTPRVLQ
jgi:hypothetical protein